MCFKNKVVLITGAGSGIGEEIAVHFAKLSARLSLLDINAETLNKVVGKCEKLNNSMVVAMVLDVTKDEDVKQAVDKTVEKFRTIHVVVNCAGIVRRVGLLDHDFITSFDKVLNVNLRSYAVMTHYVAAALIESKGCVINISSILAKVAVIKCIPYTTSKAGVTHFTRNAALELADKGVRVNSISPGILKTNLLTNSGFSQEDINMIKKKPPPLQHGILKADEIAKLTVYLASDEAKSITGADFVIDCSEMLVQTLLENNVF